MNEFLTKIVENPIWQWIWLIAMCVSIFWYAQKDDKKTIKIFILSNIVWILHFYYMWILAAMVTCIIWIIRSFLSLRYKKNKKIFYWIIASILVAWAFTYEWTLSLLPIIASCISAYWFFFLERIRLRLFLFISSICWLTFSIWTFSIWWIINDTIVQIVSIITMYKMIKYEWQRLQFVDRIMNIVRKPEPDLWRFTFISDYVKIKNYWIKNKIINFGKNAKNKIKKTYKKLDSTKIYLFKDKKLFKIEKEKSFL